MSVYLYVDLRCAFYPLEIKCIIIICATRDFLKTKLYFNRNIVKCVDNKSFGSAKTAGTGDIGFKPYDVCHLLRASSCCDIVSC